MNNDMTNKKMYIHTMGCQMNVYDSYRIAAMLKPMGYSETSSWENADLIILNTCTIRQKAEQKAFSFLGRLGKLKKKNSNLIVAVGGCVAQQEKEQILDRMPVVDLVFGTHALSRLCEHVYHLETCDDRIVDVTMSESVHEPDIPVDVSKPGDVKAFVTIMQGCDNFCTYCVVPYVRGREISRQPDKIIEEIKMLANSNIREITLLGQNVNSYGIKQKLCSFAELIHRVNDIEDIVRIRFTTSHPKDLSDELIDAFGQCHKLCHHIHLPVQAGSDRVLKRMNRKYSRDEYIRKVNRLKAVCPDIAITSDIIVGFPGETKQDFIQTLDLIEKVGYDSLYAFKYSDRPNVPATRFSNKVSEPEKSERLKQLLTLQEKLTLKKHKDMVGTTEQILVEGLSKKQASDSHKQYHWTGRTSTNKAVNFSFPIHHKDNGAPLTGRLVNVKIIKAFSHSLWGKPVDIESERMSSKGDNYHAA